LIPSPTPDYGFDYNGTRDNYVVDEEKMQVVLRIFRMVGAEGDSLNGVKKTFDREGIPTPRVLDTGATLSYSGLSPTTCTSPTFSRR
jgi:hypothetical protein